MTILAYPDHKERTMWNVAIIEDDQLLLNELADFIAQQEELNCLLTALSLGAFFENWRPELQIDLLLLDIALGAQNSLDHLQKVKKMIPQGKVIIMTGMTEPTFLTKALEEGADSYYLKGSDLEQFRQVIDITLRGGAYIAPDIAPELVSFFRKKAEKKEDSTQLHLQRLQKSYALHEREMQVAQGLMMGQSYEEIGRSLNIALNTVRHYVKSIYRKLDINNKVQLIRKLRGEA